jgi:hypothetical protein
MQRLRQERNLDKQLQGRKADAENNDKLMDDAEKIMVEK